MQSDSSGRASLWGMAVVGYVPGLPDLRRRKRANWSDHLSLARTGRYLGQKQGGRCFCEGKPAFRQEKASANLQTSVLP